jgi:uncharacterized protein YjfI (DUF2170 family)
MYSSPFIFDQTKKTVALERVSLGAGFNEAWLQARLFENAHSMPFNEIDPAYQQVCPLCIEMNTSAGPIDIVYVTPQGRLVIVETKLWRNPEARRKVVGQILDYAKELATWGYSDLQREVSKRTGIKGNAPFKIISDKISGINEAEFVDGVSKSLRRGDFMLVIAGDGIRQETQSILRFLEDTAHLRFVLSLVEVGVYKHPEEDYYVIQPRILLKTKTIERVYLREALEEAEIAKPASSNEVEEWRLQYLSYWSTLLKDLQLDDPDQPIANAVAAGGITFSLPPSGGVAWLTVYFSKADKEVGCFVRLVNKPIGHELYEGLQQMKDAIEGELPFSVTWDEDRKVKRKLAVEGNWPPLNNKQVDSFFKETINAFINAFKPRLEQLTEDS